MANKAVVLADGEFPLQGSPAWKALCEAQNIICTDGAIDTLCAHGIIPMAVVGDCDSLSDASRERFADIIHADADQNTNDLTKAVHFCLAHNMDDITIVGATGKREDHTIGNISLLLEYAQLCTVRMITDRGVFTPINGRTSFECCKGDQVSIFAIDPNQKIHYEGLRYALPDNRARSWWSGTLNECTENRFVIDTAASAIIFQPFVR